MAPTRRLLIVATLLVGTSWAPAYAELPVGVSNGGYDLKPVGRGRLTWLGFGIYEASLWSADGRYEESRDDRVMALALWYERKFSRSELIDITVGEWQRLGIAAPAVRAAWARRLETLWSDVERGDNMTAVVLPGRETRFYDRDGLVGRVEDPAFGPAYLRIWLDSRSAVADLRAELLGAGTVN